MNFVGLAYNVRTEEDAIVFLEDKGLLKNPRRCRNIHNMISKQKKSLKSLQVSCDVI